MPAAMVPRPWDFPDPPQLVEPPAKATTPGANALPTEPMPTVPGQTSTPSFPSSSPGEATGPLPSLSPATPPPAPLIPILTGSSA
jgi:hypothetical protein